MQRIILLSVFVLLSLQGVSNNIKVGSEAKVVGFVGDTAIVEFNISWNNSWRDDFNWDAAWIFLKYKKRGAVAEWNHAYLTREGHDVVPLAGNEGGGYSFMFGEAGTAANAKVTGLFLMRDGLSDGKVNATLRIKWPVKSNSRQPLAKADFGTNLDSIYVAAYATEMVYVPYGSYYLGDDRSKGSFVRNGFTPLPAEYDIVDQHSGYIFKSNAIAVTWGHTSPYNLADRINYPDWVVANDGKYTWHNNTVHNNIWFSIDLGENNEKHIRYFGISGARNLAHQRPVGNWFFQGSDDDVNWTNLWSGGLEYWPSGDISYPIQRAAKVTNPGKYRYYRVFVPTGNPLSAQNFAMTEKDLFESGLNYCVLSEAAITLDTDLKADDGAAWTGTLPAAYPKGYRGYYMMKYEVSQEHYVEFLNSLTLNQQKSRVANSDFAGMVRGDYVFGSLKQPNNRNGIAFVMTKENGGPAVFGNNLNPDSKFFSDDDGQTLACNYLSPADMLAYCDWSGLRPMSEMEYEKACRRPYPQIPERGEFAWNSNAGVNKILTEGELNSASTERESPADYRKNVNAGGKLNGPVRNGAFAAQRTSQQEAGATYWGGMEMSGNLWEMCYNANASGRSLKSDDLNYSHGDGNITDAGTDIAATYWPNAKEAFAVRGGSFASPDSLLRTSDRTFASGNYFPAFTQRDSSVGFRAVRSVLNTTGFAAGNIVCENGLLQDTTCAGLASYTILGDEPENAIGKVTYLWACSADNGTTWENVEGVSGKSLVYSQLQNATTTLRTILFKRKAMCAVGEETTNAVTLKINPAVPSPVMPKNLYAGLGYKFRFPCPVNGKLICKWEFPDGSVQTGPDVIIDTYVASDDGIYKVFYADENGCESARIDVSIQGVHEIILVDYGSYRGWGDGSYAKSAKEYLNPEPPYFYMGATGDGVYRIDPDWIGGVDPKNVYCNMTNAGGGWMMIVNGVRGTAVSTLCTANEYNSNVLGNYSQSHKLADSWVNKLSYTAYWTEGRDACNKISNSYWKKSECTNGGIFATPNTTTCCYIRYGDAAMTQGKHEGTYRRNMFDDDRSNDAYFIWPYTSSTVFIEWGHACNNGGASTGEYRIWVR